MSLKLPNKQPPRGPDRLKLPHSPPCPTPSPSLLCTLVPCLPCGTHSVLLSVELPPWE